MPMAGRLQASAKPRAAASPTRKPVKLPGPTVATMRSIVSKPTAAVFITRSTMGNSASAWPRPISWDSMASGTSSSVSKTVAEQASSAVSMARMRMALAAARSDRADLDHVRHEVAQEVLDAVLQRQGRRWAAGARALHVEIDHALAEAAEGDVAAVVGNRRAH